MRKPLYVAAALMLLLGLAAGVRPAAAQSKSDEAAIKALYSKFNDAFNKKDVDGIMSVYAPDVFVFDVVPPREYSGCWIGWCSELRSSALHFVSP